MKITKFFMVIVSLMFSFVLIGSIYAANEIVVGCIADLTGPYAALSKQQVDAVKMAVDDLNKAGGALGRKFRVVVEDTGTTVAGATQKLERMILQEKADFIIPPTTSSEVLAMMPMVNKYNKLMMVTLAQSDKITGSEKNKQTFRNFGQPLITAPPMVRWMMKNYGKKYYILANDYAWGRSAAAVYTKFLKEANANIVGETFFPLGTKDFAPYFGKVKAANPDVLLLLCAGTDALGIVAQVNQYGLKKQYKVAGDGSLVSGDIIKAHGCNADGIVFADFYVDTLDTPENKAWVERYVKLYKEKPSKMAVASYEGVLWVAQAIKQAGSLDTDKLIAALEGSTFKGPSGVKKMDPESHQASMDVYMITIHDCGKYKIIGKAE